MILVAEIPLLETVENLLSFVPPASLEGESGREKTQTFQCGRSISRGWCQEEVSLSISQQAETYRTFLKFTSAQKALKLKHQIVILFTVMTDSLNDSTLIIMSSLTWLQGQ